MNFDVKSIPKFEKNLKRLAKNYPSLKKEFANLVFSLKRNPFTGTPVGKNCYKIRLSIASKGKGKSGGGRVITNIVIENKTVYLLTIYDKSEKSNLSDNELKDLIQSLNQ